MEKFLSSQDMEKDEIKETAFEALELKQKSSPVGDIRGEVNFREAAFIKGLENLAPHSGDQPILLNTDNYKQATPTEYFGCWC